LAGRLRQRCDAGAVGPTAGVVELAEQDLRALAYQAIVD
jgi:hypothetical protein